MNIKGTIGKNDFETQKFGIMRASILSLFSKVIDPNENTDTINLRRIFLEKIKAALKSDPLNPNYTLLWSFYGSSLGKTKIEAKEVLRKFSKNKDFGKSLEIFCEICSVKDNNLNAGFFDLDTMCDIFEVYIVIEGEKYPKNRIDDRLTIDALDYIDFYEIDQSFYKKSKQILPLVKNFQEITTKFEVFNSKDFQVIKNQNKINELKDFTITTTESDIFNFKTSKKSSYSSLIDKIKNIISELEFMCLEHCFLAKKFEPINNLVKEISEALISLRKDLDESIGFEEKSDNLSYDCMENSELNIKSHNKNRYISKLNSTLGRAYPIVKKNSSCTTAESSQFDETSFAELAKKIIKLEYFYCLLCKEKIKAEHFSFNCLEKCKICDMCRSTDKRYCSQCRYEFTESEKKSLMIIDLLE